MKENISDFEIMAPVGSRESLAAAIQAGAGSVYFGIGQLNRRSHTANHFTITICQPGFCLAILESGVLFLVPVIYIIAVKCRHKIFVVTIKAVRKVNKDSPLRLSLHFSDL